MNDNKTIVNFIFLRHGNACHNVINKIGYKRVPGDINYKDPQLTHYGVDMSIWMGCLIKNMLKIISTTDIEGAEDIEDIEEIDIIGSSPLIRAIETAYFTTRNWNKPPNKIHIFPFLRELDENIFKFPELTKYSNKAIYNIPEYAIKTIPEQKEYLLQTFGKVRSSFFDFSSVIEFPEEREEPGDIERFIIWFYKNLNKIIKRDNDNYSDNENYSDNYTTNNKQVYNVLIITHAGVIRDYFDKLVSNNMGFVLNTSCIWNNIPFSPIEEEPQIIINSSFDIEELFIDFEEKYKISQFFKYQPEHICGTDGTRCSKLCEIYNSKENKRLTRMTFNPSCVESNFK